MHSWFPLLISNVYSKRPTEGYCNIPMVENEKLRRSTSSASSYTQRTWNISSWACAKNSSASLNCSTSPTFCLLPQKSDLPWGLIYCLAADCCSASSLAARAPLPASFQGPGSGSRLPDSFASLIAWSMDTCSTTRPDWGSSRGRSRAMTSPVTGS
jgi:hypothetical protein